jgi:hypothetical protein
VGVAAVWRIVFRGASWTAAGLLWWARMRGSDVAKLWMRMFNRPTASLLHLTTLCMWLTQAITLSAQWIWRPGTFAA